MQKECISLIASASCESFTFGKEKPAGKSLPAKFALRLTRFLYIGGLGAFRPLDNLKFNGVSFLQSAVTVPDYG